MRMRVDFKNIKQYKKNLEDIKKDFPKYLGKMAVAEGNKFVREAVRITDDEKIYASKTYERSFHSDNTAQISNGKTTVGIGNYANYSGYIEKGFRSHFVPGYWRGRVFVYDPTSKKGMIVGSYTIKETRCKNGKMFKRAVPTGTVRGKWVFKRAIEKIKLTQRERFERKINYYIKRYSQRGL